jgi:hypothetical protein
MRIIRTSTNKATGRQWDYITKRSWDRTYYSYNGPIIRWRRTKAEAREAAQQAGDFQYKSQGRAA